jgi:cbb3-type cytochrome oxidase maturation protein
MELFLVLIPVTVVLVLVSLWAFVWSARNEQFDDLDRQAWSILFEEPERRGEAEQPNAELHAEDAPR